VKRFRYWIEWILVKLFGCIIHSLPFGAVQRLAEIAGSIVFWLDYKGRRVALANLEVAFGSELDASQRGQIARRSLQVFARNFLQLFWTRRLSARNVERYFSFEDSEKFREFLEYDGPVIAITPHFGNVELVGATLGFRGFPFNIVAQPLKNELLTPLFTELREAPGHKVMTPDNAAVRFLKALRAGESVFLLSDLTLKLRDAAVIIDAFGLKTRVTQIHAFLHLRSGAPILPWVTLPRPDGGCMIRLLPWLRFQPNTSYQEIAQACWNLFEPIIRAYPQNWLWVYKHWRYRPSVATRSYPFYANSSTQFDLEVESQERPEKAESLAALIRDHARWQREKQ
jgi:Kdo2-lipid IVA lauroyltransferase/acyltransferase